MRSSLSRKFLIGLGVATLTFTVVATLAAFVVFQRELASRQIAYLTDYVQERASNLSRNFSNVHSIQAGAVESLGRRMASLTPADAHALLDRELPLRTDGTRRSRPAAFDGEIGANGALVYGMGGFLRDGAHIPDLEARALAAAYPIVASFGQAAHGYYDNFYFYTTNNRLIIFGPDRPDHLRFYRELAPADLDFSKEEIATIIRPAVNPLHLTRCTSLQRLIQATASARTGTGCATPAYFDGQLVGAFASTIDLNAFFAEAVRPTLPAASSFIIRSDGHLIAYPKTAFSHAPTETDVARFEQSHGMAEIAHRLTATGKSHGVLVSPDGKDLVAFGQLTGPGWYYLIRYPAAAVTWSAVGSASVVLLLGLVAAVLQTLVILRLARGLIIHPLRDLAASCETRGSAAAQALETREDETGVLARALRDERAAADATTSSLEERVQERTAELEKANAEKSRFLANMSHELRTPLNGVIAVSETLAQEQTSPRHRELAQLIAASGRLLEQVLTDILDFSKIEAGEMRLEQRPFDLAVTARRIAELHRPAAEAKDITLGYEIAPAAEGMFVGDEVRLSQVLSNLLSNAVKFTAQGGVGLRVRGDGPDVVLEISDTGIGFDEDAKRRLFHRFQQADVSIRRRFGGTGLGLAICRSLVDLMGGAITAQSVPNEGATFTVRIPLERSERVALADAAEETGPADLEGLQVLLAEDHPTNQRVVRLILESVGVELTVVENGALAVEAFAAQRFDLVLMDMQMPEMDGLTATARIRAREAELGAPRTPIVMLTANALDEHVQASLAAGADRHLSKPLRPMDLLNAVASLAGQAQGESGDRAAA